MTLPSIETARLSLRPASLGDNEALWQLWTLPEVRRFMFGDTIMTHEETAGWIGLAESLHDRGLGAWVVEDRAGHLLGHVALVPIDDIPSRDPRFDDDIEFGIALRPEFWGKGYALEALTPVLRHGLEGAGLARILGVADKPNQASRELQRRAGFVEVCELAAEPFPIVISACSGRNA